jgi:hypothetical protein
LIKLSIDSENIVQVSDGNKSQQTTIKLSKQKWHKIIIDFNSISAEYNLFINDEFVVKGNNFAGNGIPERIDFRTGEYRLNRKITEYKSGDKSKPGWDEPNAGIPVEDATYYIRNFSTEIRK